MNYQGIAISAQWPVYVIASYIILYPLVYQVNWYFLPSGIAGLTLMQWLHLVVAACFFVFFFCCRTKENVNSRLFQKVLVLFIAGFAVIKLIHLLRGIGIEHTLEGDTPFWYARIIFALVFAYIVSRFIVVPRDARLLVECISISALLTALTVFLFYFISPEGTIASYAREGVRASAGAAGVSVRAVVGLLTIGFFTSLYLWMRRYSVLGLPVAFISLLALLMTFNRAGQVALLGGVAVFSVWWLFSRGGSVWSRWIMKSIMIIVALAAMALFVFGLEPFLVRWEVDIIAGTLGSGRNELYQAAVVWFMNGASVLDILFGRGYGGVGAIIYEYAGWAGLATIHSDPLNLLITGGLVGLLLYGSFFYCIAATARRVDMQSLEYGILLSVAAAVLVMSLVTAIFSIMQVMTVFLVFCIAMQVIKPARNAEKAMIR